MRLASLGAQVILADPAGSVFKPYFNTGKLIKAKSFLVEGVGKGNIPGCMDFAVVDGAIEVTDQDAITMCKTIARKTGLCVGGNAGLNVAAACKIAESSEEALTICTLLCDNGVKYLSKIFNEEWLAKNGIVEEVMS